MGHWLDALAKASTGRRDDHGTSSISETAQTPGSGRPTDDASVQHAQGLTRRALFKRGAVVGAALWTTPVLQTALAPAASASVNPCVGICGVGACPVCGPGVGTCTNNTQCATGLCYNGICVIPYGATTPCTGSNQCQSGNCSGTTGSPGVCIASWPGTTCTTDTQCLSGKCNGGRCFENPKGGLCRAAADCTDNITCSSTTKTCGGDGAVCANNNKCVSNRCQGGICVP